MFSSFQRIGLQQAENYHAEDDYYNGSEHEKMPTEFYGKLVDKFGLKPGAEGFSQEDFKNSLRGKFPAGQLKTHEKEKFKATFVAFDGTADAPKSVSMAALVYGRTDVVDAHNAATKAMVDAIEKKACVRVTEDHKTQEVHTGELLASLIGHTTSREGDPHLHTHVVISKWVEHNGELRSIEAKEMMENVKYFGAVYRDELAKQLRARGYKLEAREGGFEIAGIPEDLRMDLSKRHVQIVQHLIAKGMSPKAASSEAQRLAHRDTRQSKRKYDRDALQEWWCDQTAYGHACHNAKQAGLPVPNILDFYRERIAARKAAGVNWDRNIGLEPPKVGAPSEIDRTVEVTDEVLKWVRTAVSAHMSRTAMFKNVGELVRMACELSGYTADLKSVEAGIDQLVATGELLYLDNNKSLTAGWMKQSEEYLRNAYMSGMEKAVPLATPTAVASVIAAAEKQLGGQMTADQRAMINTILLGTDRVITVEGDAGTGKSTGLTAVKTHEAGSSAAAAEMAIGRSVTDPAARAEHLEGLKNLADTMRTAGKYKLLGLAPSNSAVEALQESGIPTITSQKACMSEQFWNDVDANTIVVIDEAGLLGTESLAKITKRIEERGARLVLVGDPKQYQAVEAGKPFKQLHELAQHHGKGARLAAMRRGRTDEIKALHFAARDDQAKAIIDMFEQGRVKAINKPEARAAYVAREFATLDAETQDKSLILTGTNESRIRLNAAVRASLGLVGGHRIHSFEARSLSRAEALSLTSYNDGDTIRFRAAAGLFKKGEAVTVLGHDPLREGWLLVRRNDGTTVGYHPEQHSEAVTIGRIERIEIAKGEIVRFTDTNRDAGYKNGDRGRVIGIDENGQAEVKLFSNGKTVRVNLNQDPIGLRHGYAATGHSAQGMTAKGKVWLVVNSTDSTLSKQSLYTDLTRSTLHVELVTDAKRADQIAELIARAQTETEKVSVINMAKPAAPANQIRRKLQPISAFWSSDPDAAHRHIRADAGKLGEQIKEARVNWGDKLTVTGPEAFKKAVAREILKLEPDDRAKLTLDRTMQAMIREVEREAREKAVLERAREAQRADELASRVRASTMQSHEVLQVAAADSDTTNDARIAVAAGGDFRKAQALVEAERQADMRAEAAKPASPTAAQSPAVGRLQPKHDSQAEAQPFEKKLREQAQAQVVRRRKPSVHSQ